MKLFYKILIVLAIVSFSFQCDEEECNQPNCLYSDVKVTIDAKLHGKLDSIINIGDTIWLQVKIPDTLRTNYAEIVIQQLWEENFFGISSGGGDSILPGVNGNFLNYFELNPQSFLPQLSSTGLRKWDLSTRNFICYFTPKKKGKYFIFLVSGMISIKDINNQNWNINVDLKMEKTARIHQFLSWRPEPMPINDINKLIKNNNWYCFEVK
jgi:hypothetical protein